MVPFGWLEKNPLLVSDGELTHDQDFQNFPGPGGH